MGFKIDRSENLRFSDNYGSKPTLQLRTLCPQRVYNQALLFFFLDSSLDLSLDSSLDLSLDVSSDSSLVLGILLPFAALSRADLALGRSSQLNVDCGSMAFTVEIFLLRHNTIRKSVAKCRQNRLTVLV
jgi:hypothetical protein